MKLVFFLFNKRSRLRQYPALINCTTIDWFLDWPKETLLEIATVSLYNLDISEIITEEPKVSFKETYYYTLNSFYKSQFYVFVDKWNK